MNIEGVSLSSAVNVSSKAGATSLSENGAVPDSFSTTLTGQVDLLNKTGSEISSPQSIKSAPPSLPNDTAKNIDGVLSQSNSGEDVFSKVLINKPSISYQQNPVVVAGTNLDLQSKLQALTAGKKSTLASSTPDAITIAQNMSAAMATDAQTTTSPLSDKAVSMLNDAPIPSMSDIMPDAMAVAQNMSAVMAINTPVATNILSDKTPTMLTETQNKATPMLPSDQAIVASDSLQKEAVPNQFAQSGQASDLPSFDTLLSSEKTLAVKDLLTTSDAGQVAAGVSRDITGAQQPVITNKIESPVLTKPLTHPEWSKDLGNQIIWMNSKELSTAEIKMNPEHLGPISVRIDLTQDQASVEFTAQHAAVKEALEASIPKLREMLGTQQLNLTNVTISQSTTSDQGQSQSPYQSFSRTPEGQEQRIDGVATATGLSEEVAANRVVVNKGLLSVYV